MRVSNERRERHVLDAVARRKYVALRAEQRPEAIADQLAVVGLFDALRLADLQLAPRRRRDGLLLRFVDEFGANDVAESLDDRLLAEEFCARVETKAVSWARVSIEI